MIGYDFGMHRAGVLLLLLLLLARAEVAVPAIGVLADAECCAITVWVTDSASALAIMAEMCFRISSGCRAGASACQRGKRQPAAVALQTVTRLRLLYARKGGA